MRNPRQRRDVRPCANMLRALTVREASRYIELREKANEGLSQDEHHDLDDYCDRAVLDVTITSGEALELLSLHDRLRDAFAEFDDTKKISVKEMQAVR